MFYTARQKRAYFFPGFADRQSRFTIPTADYLIRTSKNAAAILKGIQDLVKKTWAIVQIIIVGLLIIYGTVSLFLGYFEGAFATFPFLLFYYVYVVARQRRQKADEEDNEDGQTL